MESQDDAIAAIIFDKDLTPQQKLDKLHKLPGAEDDTTETVKEALGKMEDLFYKKPIQKKNIFEDEVKKRMDTLAAPLNEMEKIEFGISILKAVVK
ncbi:hypothetical protein WR25_00753 [Diploscapter pachys]|uniref:Uncharacterized protein n=1 Tax=Diploscapter pachys TaxID=2018661 RepID=A0A2A2LEG2_9BILA|nr:hypothetical protein WR25_00753 [Diploscapter pachys]